MAAAATSLGLTEVDMASWSHEWLDSAGCSEISIELQEGAISKAKINQKLFGNHEKNRLRTQKF
jgi:hypothetical protein